MITQDNNTSNSKMIRTTTGITKDMSIVRIAKTQERVRLLSVATAETVTPAIMLGVEILGSGIIQKRDLLFSSKRLAYSILSQLNSTLRLHPSQET